MQFFVVFEKFARAYLVQIALEIIWLLLQINFISWSVVSVKNSQIQTGAKTAICYMVRYLKKSRQIKELDASCRNAYR